MRIDPQDRYRIIRALAIFKGTGQNPSQFEQIFDPLSSYLFINLCRDREILYERINQRVVSMIEQGWVQEVQNLPKQWHDFIMKKKIIGYDDILLTLQHRESLSLVIPKIQQKTRNYAKRQITFFKKLQKSLSEQLLPRYLVGSVEQIDLTLCDVGLYISQLLSKFK